MKIIPIIKKIGTKTTQYTFLNENPSSYVSSSSVFKNASSTIKDDARTIRTTKINKYLSKPYKNLLVHTLSYFRYKE